MSLDELLIYETAHGADSVEHHLEELRDWEVTPGFIGLELPTDGVSIQFRDLLKRSPSTALAYAIAAKLQRRFIARGSSNGSRSVSEYEAGRRFGEEIGASVENVDRSRKAIFRDYLTWNRRVKDALLMTGAVLCGLLAVMLFLIVAIGLPQSEISIRTLANTAIFLLLAAFLCRGSLLLLNQVLTAFKDGIRGARDEEMFESTAEWGEEEGNNEALIIAGKAHSTGLKERAVERGIDVDLRSAPSIREIEGDSFGVKEAKQVYLDE